MKENEYKQAAMEHRGRRGRREERDVERRRRH